MDNSSERSDSELADSLIKFEMKIVQSYYHSQRLDYPQTTRSLRLRFETFVEICRSYRTIVRDSRKKIYCFYTEQIFDII